MRDESKWTQIVLPDLGIPTLSNYDAHPDGLVRNRKTKYILRRKKSANKLAYFEWSFRKRTIMFHKVIALMFVPNDDIVNKTDVDHIDEVKTNNAASNLQWITHSDNVKKTIVLKGRKDGKSAATPIKLTYPTGEVKYFDNQVLCMKELNLTGSGAIRSSIVDNNGYYYGRCGRLTDKDKQWIYKFEYVGAKVDDTVKRKQITVEYFTHLIACDNGVILNKKNGKEITGSFDGDYLRIKSTNDGKVTTGKHRLIAIMFIPNPDDLPYVNHKDGDKLNNEASNLEWTTQKENMQHAINTGLSSVEKISKNDYDPTIHNKKGVNYILSEPILKLDNNGNIIKEFGCVDDVIKSNTDYKKNTIYHKCRKYRDGENHLCYGFGWCYKKDYKQ